jgi:Trk K+ transport system NAD-binding subunit
MRTGTPPTQSALVIGSGHLAYRIKRLLQSRGTAVTHIRAEAFVADRSEESRLEIVTRVLRDIDLSALPFVLLVDESDEQNLGLLIALISMNRDLRIVASLFNENVAPHLKAAHPNVRVLNPAKIAAPTFIAALDEPRTLTLRYVPLPMAKEAPPKSSDQLVRRLVIGFVALVILATLYFHAAEGLSLLSALYFVIVTVATVGYGDISLANSGPASKLVGIALILCSTVFIWMIFSLTVDRIIKHRVQVSLGRRRYSLRDHVILCGLGRLGFFIAEGLLARGEKVLIIERNEDSPNIHHFRARGAEVYIGDARLPTVLQDAAVTNAKALFAVVDNDFTNAEIGLNARSFVPELRLVLRIYDDSVSRMIKENLDIHLTYSTSAIADESFVAALVGE